MEIRLQLQHDFIPGLLVCSSFQFMVFPYTFDFLELDRCSRGLVVCSSAVCLLLQYSNKYGHMDKQSHHILPGTRGGSDHRTLMLMGTKMLNSK